MVIPSLLGVSVPLGNPTISVLLKSPCYHGPWWNHNLELSISMGPRPSWLYKVMVIHWKKTGVPRVSPREPRSAARQVPRDPALIHRRRPHGSRRSGAVGPLLQRLRSHTTRRRQRLKWAPACGQMWRFQRGKKWGCNGDITMAGRSHGSFDGKMIYQYKTT